VKPSTCTIASGGDADGAPGNLQLVGLLWPQLPSERVVMEPYSSLFLSNRVNRYDLKLVLGSVHVRFYIYVTSLIPLKASGLLTLQILLSSSAVKVL
jgi:hypothetical protein